MSDPALDIEIRLAEALADSYARDESLLEYMPELADVSDEDRDAVLDLYEDGLIDLALDEIAVQEERARQPKRPRTAIERMVDEACGIEVRDDGTIVELRR